MSSADIPYLTASCSCSPRSLGSLKETGRPYGLAFIGTAFSERTLIRLMSAYEANFAPRQVPAQLV